MGLYLMRVLTPDGKTFLDVPLRPVERFFYRCWALTAGRTGLEAVHAIHAAVHAVGNVPDLWDSPLAAILRKSAALAAVSDQLSFNTAASFTTNTNCAELRRRKHECRISRRWWVWRFHNFVSAGWVLPWRRRLIRALPEVPPRLIGNFWVDLVRTKFCICWCRSGLLIAIFLVSQGHDHEFSSHTTPCSLSSILLPIPWRIRKRLLRPDGFSGGDQNASARTAAAFFNANGAHPYEESESALEFHSDASRSFPSARD